MCTRQLTVINPHYKKLAEDFNVSIKCFTGREDFMLHVPCGHCDECLKKRQQQWFLRANHVVKRLKLRPEQCLFCTFSIKPEVYEQIKEKPYLAIRRFLDRLRKHPRFREKGSSGRYRYRKVRFPYIFVLEFADGKRARERGLESTHRMHFHAILFNCPLYWWQVRDLWESCVGRAWVDPLNSEAGIRYVLKYITKDCKSHQYISDIDARKNGKLFVSHGFGRLSKEDIKIMRENLLRSSTSWFCVYINNFRYSIPRYWRTACFTKDEIKCRNDSLIPAILWSIVQQKYRGYSPIQQQQIYCSLLWA